MRWLRLVAAGSAILAAALAGLPAANPAQAAPAGQSNPTLENGSFEGSFEPWETWAVVQGSDCTYQQPEFDIITIFGSDTLHVMEGHDAVRIRIDGNRSYWAGVRQTVGNVTIGQIIEFSSRVQMDANLGSDNTPSNLAGQANLRVGIDPTGGNSVTSSSIVWSAPENRYDAYYEATVQATAQATSITVYVSANPTACNENNYSFFDKAEMKVVGFGPTPTNTLAPSATPPAATAAPTGTSAVAPASTSAPQPQATSAPLLTPTPAPDGAIVYTVQPGDTLTAIAVAAGTTVEQLQALNGLSDTNIVIGQQLILATAPPTASPTLAPTETLAPSPTVPPLPTATPEPQTGRVCVSMYADENVDGSRSAEEPLLAGGSLQLVNPGTSVIVGEYRTTGTDEPHCFEDLEPATYMVTATGPEGYVLTGSGEIGVLLPPQGDLTLEVGATQPAASNTWAIAAGAAGAAILAGSAGFVIYRRRTRPTPEGESPES
jgi:LysM repeat protein